MKILGTLKNGEKVVQRHNPHEHNGGETRSLLLQALANIDAQGRPFIKEVVDFKKVIGMKTCVKTTDANTIVFAQRPKRKGLTRFVKNRQPEPCNKMVVILMKARDDDGYVLITHFFGELSEPEPWDKNIRTHTDFQRAKDFWKNHALVWGIDEVIQGTETNVCPW